MSHSTLIVERARHLLSYDPVTGILTRRIAAGRHGCIRAGRVAGAMRPNGYLQVSVDNRLYRAHRLAWLLTYGKWPEGDIDHINGIRHDNRLANLRDVTRSVNLQNKREAQSNSTTGKLGVIRRKEGFSARIHLNGKTHHLGVFATADLAQIAYLTAKRQLHEGNTL